MATATPPKSNTFSDLLKAGYSALFAPKNSLSLDDLKQSVSREQFSKFLPYVSYSPREQKFAMVDNTECYMWELRPHSYIGTDQLAKLELLLGHQYPQDTVMQFLYWPDSDIQPFLQNYLRDKTRDNPLLQETYRNYARFIEDACHNGLKNLAGNPVKNYRCLLVLKSKENLSEFAKEVENTLSMWAPTRWNDTQLIRFVWSLFSNRPCPTQTCANNNGSSVGHRPDRTLGQQMIDSSTEFDFRGKIFQLGDRKAAVMSLFDIERKKINALQFNALFGGYNGIDDDTNQLNFPFLYSVNILFGKTERELAAKAAVIMKQQSIKIVPGLRHRLEEFSNVSENKEDKIPYIKFIPSLMVFGQNRKEVKDNIRRVNSLWKKSKFVLQVESLLKSPMTVASLPGGLYNIGNNVSSFDRHFYAELPTMAAMLPVQSDWSGNGGATSIFIGRKGQIAGIDIFAPGSQNYNYLVAAESGAGKSFTIGTILDDNYASGNKVRIIDIGGSYKQSCRNNNGKFIDIAEAGLCVNPLDFEDTGDSEDFNANIQAATLSFEEMAYAGTNQTCNKIEKMLIAQAARDVYAKDKLSGSDGIYQWFLHYDDAAKLDPVPQWYDEVYSKIARNLALFFSDWARGGPYERYFVGKSSLDISKDDYVVVELEAVKGDVNLFPVIVLQMMNAITHDLYLSDRQNRRFILFEEAPSILKEQKQSSTIGALAMMMNEGYRRARKYQGSFGVVVQSLLDLKLMGDVGHVILQNSAYKFLLSAQSNQYVTAAQENILNYNEEDFAVRLMQSLVNNKPHYSEIFFETPQSSGVGRLLVNPWRYWTRTTEGEEIALLNTLVKEGLSSFDAIALLSSFPHVNDVYRELTKMQRLSPADAAMAILGQHMESVRSEYSELFEQLCKHGYKEFQAMQFCDLRPRRVQYFYQETKSSKQVDIDRLMTFIMSDDFDQNYDELLASDLVSDAA